MLTVNQLIVSRSSTANQFPELMISCLLTYYWSTIVCFIVTHISCHHARCDPGSDPVIVVNMPPNDWFMHICALLMSHMCRHHMFTTSWSIRWYNVVSITLYMIYHRLPLYGVCAAEAVTFLWQWCSPLCAHALMNYINTIEHKNEYQSIKINQYRFL